MILRTRKFISPSLLEFSVLKVQPVTTSHVPTAVIVPPCDQSCQPGILYQGRLSTHALHKSSPYCSTCFLVLKLRLLDSIRLISIGWFRSGSKTSPREYHRFSGAGTATP